MKPEYLNATLKFLMRVDLKGSEVPAFVQVIEALQDELSAAQTAAAADGEADVE